MAWLVLAVPSQAEPFRFHITRSSVVGSVVAGPPGGDARTDIEVDEALLGDVDATSGQPILNRSVAPDIANGPVVRSHAKAKSNPELVTTFVGLNHHDQRFANGGNQFNVEPPDQALCAGNGFVLESVNEALRVRDQNGLPLTDPVDLNTFYGYPAAVDRATVQFGPETTDPSCYYDADTRRWFHVVLTLDRASPNGQALGGPNRLDIAVSTSPDPRGSWVIYRVPVQNNGTEGTPDHHCVGGFCMGDFPHIGADAHGFYVTTNEFNLFAPGFRASLIYAFSKQQLASNAATANAVLFDTSDPGFRLDGTPGFTVWPAQSPAAVYDSGSSGTEYLLSSQAVFSRTGLDNRLRLWTITNTSSLASVDPSPVLTTRAVSVEPYGIPPRSVQKPGDIPLRDCIADTTILPDFGLACWQLFGLPFAFDNPLMRLPSSDSRMNQVSYANGKLWGALNTGIRFVGNNTLFAGIAYFVLNPDSGKVVQQGYLALLNNNLIYPAPAVNVDGRGAITFTIVGADHHPSAGYASLDAKIGAGDIHVISEGVGPEDGFLGYRPIGGNPTTRPRWGDYGAAAVDGNDIWIASESIEQTCTYAEYLLDVANSRFGTCDETRNSLANWATRISKLRVSEP
jgi:hypothetical protein